MSEDGVHESSMPAPARGGNDTPARATLVLGGARSGKSGFAQGVAERSGRVPVFCATAADWGDAEMAARVAAHRDGRDARWRTVEAPLDLVGALAGAARPECVVVVDCLTLWLTNVMLGGGDVPAACAALLAAVPTLAGPVLFVSNEVGAGIVPENALARRFRDAQGRLNQGMARVCDTVVLVTAGLPTRLKPGVPVRLALA